MKARASPSRLQGLRQLLDAITRWAMPPSLAITVPLALQWPLRDAVGAGSTQANDLGQALFALYVAAALRHAGVRQLHLVARPDLAPPQVAAAALARWRRLGAPLCVLPFALYLLAAGAPEVWRSVRVLEPFPETLNPGYFVLRLAMLLLAALLAGQAVLDLRDAWRGEAV